MDTTSPDGPWINFFFRQNALASDLSYVLKSSNDLVSWESVAFDGITAIAEVANQDPDGDGTALLRKLRIKTNTGEPRKFLKLQISN